MIQLATMACHDGEGLPGRFRVVAEPRAELEGPDGQKTLLLSIIGHDLLPPFDVLLDHGDMPVDQGTTMERSRLAAVFQNMLDACICLIPCHDLVQAKAAAGWAAGASQAMRALRRSASQVATASRAPEWRPPWGSIRK